MEDRSLFERNKLYTQKNVERMAWLFFSTGSEREQTLNENEAAFKKLVLQPKYLPDKEGKELNLKTQILGKEIDLPIAISPSAYHKVMHPEGELGTAKAAGVMNTCYVQSHYSTTTIEEVSESFPNTLRWLNCRSYREKEYLVKLIKRAENCGYRALVITVDSAVAKRIPYKLPPHLKVANLPLTPLGISSNKPILQYIPVSWEEVEWFKSVTKLPIILKGILTAEDAKVAVQKGIAAIYVSNHGGRELDGAPATINVLAEITEAVGDQVDVYFDGGVRCGADVLKALALGAKAVFLGKPILYGLCFDGGNGVLEVLNEMKEQLILAMEHTGCTDVTKIPKSIVKLRNVTQFNSNL